MKVIVNVNSVKLLVGKLLSSMVLHGNWDAKSNAPCVDVYHYYFLLINVLQVEIQTPIRR